MTADALRSSESARAVTLNDVAAAAGVSRATASLVLRRSPLVADQTRERVLQTMDQLGYVYNRAAAALRSSTTGVVAVIIPDIRNPYFAELAVGLENVFRENRRSVFLMHSHDDAGRQQELLSRVVELRAERLIICPARETLPSAFRQVIAANIPVVLISRRVRGAHLPYVGPDNRRLGAIAAHHLMELGHDRIAFLGGEDGSSARSERLAGVVSALNSNGLAVEAHMQPQCRPTRGDAMRVTEDFYREWQPTAIVAYNDVVALGVMDGLLRCGLEPGPGCSVVGFDDIPESARTRPALTTVAVPVLEIAGRAAAVSARDHAGRAAARPSRVTGRLVVRGSTAPPARL